MSNRDGSIRILFDLHACQTPQSAKRGVGRYSNSLFSSVYSQAGAREIMALASEHLLCDPELPSFFPRHKVLKMPLVPDWPTNAIWKGGDADLLDGLAYNAFTAPWRFDVVHLSHTFESERVALPDVRHKAAGQIISATVYDLIPLALSNFYFQDDNFRRWYLSRVGWLRNADLLLAISESTRQDVIRYLGIPSWRVVNISGGIPFTSSPPRTEFAGCEPIKEKFGLSRPYVMYTGGDEYRKNIAGVITGFGALPHQTRIAHQLVIVCNITEASKISYQRQAAQMGLSAEDLVFTGYVSDEEMASLYRESAAFIFPSLYEGFGLPLVEAMAHGAAVIGSDNSSMREIINRTDAVFNAEDPQDIARVLNNVLTDRYFARELSEYGLKRAQDFSFEKSGKIALEAFDEALARVRCAGTDGVVQGLVPMKRLAYLSPLPPDESGVATYSAGFLPYLARYFNIDIYIEGPVSSDLYLNSTMRIFHVSELDAVASNYDAILYEFGNSHFHKHMFDLLARCPGVVTLHDGLMCDIAMHMPMLTPDVDYFFREGLYSHGPRFRRLWLDEGKKNQIMTLLPCTKRFLNNAIGVISHSSYNLDLCRTHYPEGVRAPYRIVPQAIFAPVPIDEYRRKSILDKLGCPEDAFIVGTFGFIAESKMADVLLAAFLNSQLAEEKNAFLFFVGQACGDAVGLAVKRTAVTNNLNNRIRVTDFLQADEFNEFLQICDVGVQLRQTTRGGTPRGALDVLANKTALVVNQYASYLDYPDDVVIKLSARPDKKELGDVLEDLYNNPAKVEFYKKAGYDYVVQFHDPDRCAAEYAASIHEFYDRYHQQSSKIKGRLMAPYLASCNDVVGAAQAAENWLHNVPNPSFARPKLMMDASYISTDDSGTGTARTTKCLIKAAYLSDQPGFEPIAVTMNGGQLAYPKNWLNDSLNCLLPYEVRPDIEPDLTFADGDILLLLDTSWFLYDQFLPVFDQARRAGTEIVTAVYDILPLSLPAAFVPQVSALFERWLRLAATHSDRLLGISKTTMESVRAWVQTNMPERSDMLKFDYWHLGVDKESEPRLSPRLEGLLGTSFFLMVGTIEPRKNHELALKAVKMLVARGQNINLCIAGRAGWMVEAFMEELNGDTAENSLVTFVEAPDDQELAWLYSQSRALLYPSQGEGFGLPPIEAAAYGTPVICSDIPVLHEVCGPYASYIRIDNANNMADDLRLWLEKDDRGLTPESSQMPRLTWDQSFDQLFHVLFHGSVK